MRKKLKDTGGLTFVELLCAAAILLLLVLMMGSGLSMAVKGYRDVTAESEAQLLLSDLTDALSDKLRYALVTQETTGDYKIFITKVYADGSDTLDSGTNAVKTVKVEGGQVKVDDKPLLPDGAYGAPGEAYIGRYTVEEVDASTPLVTYVSPTAGGTPSFQVKFKVKDDKAHTERTAEFTVRCLSPVKKEV